MAGKAISQVIRLEGAEEIKRQLAAIGADGSKAFEHLQGAVTQATRSLERVASSFAAVERSIAGVGNAGRNFGESINNLGDSFNRFESSILRTSRNIGLFVAGITAAAAGMAKFVSSGIKAGDDIDEQAQALGLSSQKYQELGFAASEAGVKAGQFAAGVKFFSQQLEKDASASDKALLKFLDGRKFDDFGGRIKQVGNQTGETFRAVDEGVQALQKRIVEAGGKAPLFGELRRDLLALATGTAANRAEFEEFTGVSLPASRDGLDLVRKGALSTKQALAQLGIDVTRGAAGAIDLSSHLDQIADKFATLPDGTRKTAQAIALFGKSAGPALIPMLNQGSAGIEGLLAKARELGLFLGKDQIEASSKAARSFDLLARASTNLKNQIGAALAPLAEGISGGLTKFLSENQAAVTKFADELNARAIPYIRAFFNLLSGKEDNSAEAQSLIRARDAIVGFGEAVKTVVTGVVVPAFNALVAILNTVARAINSVFGTSLTGADIGIAIIVAKLIGLFGVLGASLVLIAGAFKVLTTGMGLAATAFGLLANVIRGVVVLLAAFVGWPALIVAALIAAAVAVFVFWDEIKTAAAAAWDFVKDAASKVWDWLKDVVGNGIANAWEWIKTKATEAWEFVKKKAEEGWEAVKKFVGRTADDAWQWIVTAFDTAAAKVKQKAQELADFLKNLLINSPDKSGQGVPNEMGGSGPPAAIPQSAPGGFGAGSSQDVLKGGAGADQAQLAAFTAAAQAAQAAASALNATLAESTGALTQVGEAFTLSGGQIDEFSLKVQGLAGAFPATVAAIIQSAAGLGPALAAPFNAAADGAAAAFQGMANAASAGFQALISLVDQAVAQIDAAIQGIIARLEEAAARAAALAASAPPPSGGSTSPAFASGGYVRGPGTTTSDSIWARISRGEFVQRAAAVQYYGPQFMAALNALRIPRDMFRGFHLGGLVDGLSRSLSSLSPIPSFAGGGLNEALAPAMPHLGTVDLRTNQGTVRVMMAPNAANQLMAYSIASQHSSAGKRPRGG